MSTSSLPSQNASTMNPTHSASNHALPESLDTPSSTGQLSQPSSDTHNEQVLGVNFLRDMLYRQFSTGAHISLFSDDIDVLRRALSLHGISSFTIEPLHLSKSLHPNLAATLPVMDSEVMVSLPRKRGGLQKIPAA